METIKNYLDTMFAGLSKTPEIMKLKEDLFYNMEDKYNELKQEGKSENEAIGIVISEFGNIDELTRELGIDLKMNNQNEILPTITLQQTEKILSDKKLYGTIVGIGVSLCIMAPAIIIIITLCLGSSFSSMEKVAPLALFPFFIMIAFAVGLFIFSGLQVEKYDFLKKPFHLDYSSEVLIKDKKERYQTSHTLQIIIAVMLCIMSPLSLITLYSMDETNPTFQSIGAFILLTLIAIAVFLFIHTGSVMNSYKELLQEESFSLESKESEKLIAPIASIIWPIITAGYLIWSFLSGDWSFTWIVWPIAGILFGAFSAVFNVIHNRNK